MFVCSLHVCNADRGQKRESDSLKLKLQAVWEPPCEYWELNTGPPQEQPAS